MENGELIISNGTAGHPALNGTAKPRARTRTRAFPVWSKEAPNDITPLKIADMKMLNEVWPYVRARLAAIKKKDKTSRHWIPEHVRNEIQKGLVGQSTTELYVGVDDSKVLHGFIVTQVCLDPFINVPMTLWVWFAWLNNEMIDRFTPYLENLARERGLTQIEFDTGRFGWAGAIRKLKTSGFYMTRMQYRRDVKP